LIAQFFARPGNRFSYQWTDVALMSDRVIGLAISFPYRHLARLEWKTAWQLFQIARPGRILRLVARSLPMIGIAEAQGDDFYLSDIAVVPEARGKGIGKVLLRHVEKKALSRGFRRLALTVALDNDHAVRFYLRQGFEVTSEVTIPALQRSAGYPGFYRMVKLLPEHGGMLELRPD
jgi:ribosomal protein S18 acetylase RimI-like enzyme